MTGVASDGATSTNKAETIMKTRKTIAAALLMAMLAVFSPLASNSASAQAFDGDDLIEWITVFGEPEDPPTGGGARGSYNWCHKLLVDIVTIGEDYSTARDWWQSWGTPESGAQLIAGSGRLASLTWAATWYTSDNCEKHTGLPSVDIPGIPFG